MARPRRKATAQGPTKRLWDSCTICDYLKGVDWLRDAAQCIIQQAELGQTQIYFSMFSCVEVAFLKGKKDSDAEAMIQEFFRRPYCFPINVDERVAAKARELLRTYGPSDGLTPEDATILASALAWEIDTVETSDSKLHNLSSGLGITIDYATYRPTPGTQPVLLNPNFTSMPKMAQVIVAKPPAP